MFRKIAWRVACSVTVVAWLAACSRDHRTPLVIYSPHGRDLLTLFETRFEALHPDIDVRWLDMGSQDVYDRVRSERANPQADIWFGMPIGYVFPKSGTVAIEDGIAVVRNTKHLAAARAFVDFVGTPEMQLAAAREVFRVPARLDLPADSLPEWVRDVRRRMVVADVDWNLLAQHGAEWMQWWDQHVRGTGKPR